MIPLLRQPLPRRTVLRGLGATLALPLLEAMLPRAVHAAPSQFKPLPRTGVKPQPRAIFCYVPNGVNILQWMPKDAGANYTLSPTLEVLADHRARFSVLTGLGHPLAKGGHSGADIHLGRGNANKILLRLLRELEAMTDLRLSSLKGGTARNGAKPAGMTFTSSKPN